MKYKTSAILTLALPASAFAATPLAPSLPAAGDVIHDSNDALGTAIMRITDPTNAPSGAINSYSYWPSYNSNDTELMVGTESGSAMLFSFNPKTFTLGAERNLFLSNPPGSGPLDWQDAIWSSTDPNVIYAHANTGAKLWAYNVSTNQYTLIKDFSTVLTGATNSNNADNPQPYIWQMSKSADNTTFAFAVRTLGSYAYTGYATYNTTSGSLVVNNPVPSQGLDEVQIDKTGRYLVVKTEAQGSGALRDTILDLQAHTSTNLIDGGENGVEAFGHSDNGTGIVVAADNWNNGITVRNLATPLNVTTVLSNGNDWTQGLHISMLANDESKALVSFFTAGSGTQTEPWDNQIAFVSLTGKNQVTPLGYHYSIYNSYYDSPRADISADGRFITFTSNWGVANGRLDVYVRATPLKGDFNFDGKVDLTDLTILADHWQQSGNGFTGDVNGDGFVDLTDLTMLAADWQDQLGPNGTFTTSGASGSGMTFDQALAMFPQLESVPEPGSLGLLAIGALGLMRRRSRAVRQVRV